MKREYVIAGIVAASLVAGAGAAVADGMKHGRKGGMGPMMPDFSAVDTNGDGKLTQEEMQAHAKARFDAADTNGDGKLSVDELAAAAQKREEERRAKKAARMLERLDANNDGALSFDEMPGQQSRADRMFARMDADGDGAISKEEMDAAAAKFKERRGKHGGKHGQKGKRWAD